MQKLKSSARNSKRYLLIDGTKEAVESAILEYVGTLGWAKAEVRFVKKRGKKVVFSVNPKEVDSMRGAVALSKDRLKVLKVSGTLRGLEKG